MSQGINIAKEDLLEGAIRRADPYRAPETVPMRCALRLLRETALLRWGACTMRVPHAVDSVLAHCCGAWRAAAASLKSENTTGGPTLERIITENKYVCFVLVRARAR